MQQNNTAIDHSEELIKLLKEVANSHDLHQVFNDWLEMSAISIANALNFRQELENRYLQIINSYEKKYQFLFPQMFAHLAELLEIKMATTGPEDVLGPIFHKLELQNKDKGQFFTPQSVSDLTARIAVNADEMCQAINAKGFVSMTDPCCGGGVMPLSMCKAMRELGEVAYFVKTLFKPYKRWSSSLFVKVITQVGIGSDVVGRIPWSVAEGQTPHHVGRAAACPRCFQ
jgi:type I restriction-modification system DNA methylase subunit